MMQHIIRVGRGGYEQKQRKERDERSAGRVAEEKGGYT